MDKAKNTLLQQKQNGEGTLLQAKKDWWTAYANMDAGKMKVAEDQGKAAQSIAYVNTHTDAMQKVDNENRNFLNAKLDYYNSRIKMDAVGMN